jgi:Fic family protein
VTDPEEALAAASTAVYQPFPAFAEWAELTVRTGPLEHAEQALAELKAATTPEVLADAVNTATRSAAVDTGAIEGLYQVDRGFTRTIATEAANWEIVLGAREEETQRAIEDALAAYEFVLDAATGSRGPITEVWIKELHATICASQATHRVWTAAGWQDQALPKGEYKSQSNSPINLTTGRVHAYARVFDTPPEMQRLVGELNTPEFHAAHPVLQAAYAHYAFVCIHPFADGNGRVFRALASVYLYRNPGVPLLIFADQKLRYLDALELADAGTPQVFVDFIGGRATEAVEMVNAELSGIAARHRQAEVLGEVAHALRSDVIGLPFVEVDAAAERALAAVVQAMESGLTSLRLLPDGIQIMTSRGGRNARDEPPAGYRWVEPSGLTFLVSVQSSSPAWVSFQRSYGAYAAVDDRARAPFGVTAEDDPAHPIEFTVDDLSPTVSQVAQMRIKAWTEGEIARLVERFHAQFDLRMRELGYR